MAIAFQSTSLSGATADVTGATAQTAIRDALIAHASGAWTLVEEFDASAAFHWVALKNDHAISGNDIDFYLCIGREIATGKLGFMVGEVYTAATHTLSSFAPYTGYPPTSHRILAANFNYAQNAEGAAKAYTLSNAFPNTQQNPVCPTPTPLSTERFVSIIEKDYAVLNVNDKTVYIGALTDLIQADALIPAQIPIGIFDLWNNATGPFGALTRHPIEAGFAPMNVAYSHSIQPIASQFLCMIQHLALDTAIYNYPDRYQAKRVAASEIAALMSAGLQSADVNNDPFKVGLLRGKFKAMRAATYPGAAGNYDTIAVDGRKHIILKDQGMVNNQPSEFVQPYNAYNQIRWGYVFDTGVAA